MKILSIGNSFSQDAQRYLHELAKAEGVDIQTQNLYIGGCSLETHYQNMKGDLMEYELERNGRGTTEKTSIRIALESEDWDIIISNNQFNDFDEPVSGFERKTVIQIANTVV